MRKILAAAVIAFAGGCSFHEPGPAERIGRSIDEIRKGIAELAPEETAEERRQREDREWRRRQDEYYRSHLGSDYVTGSSRTRNEDMNLYGEELRKREQEERDREFWSRPPADEPESNRY